MARNELVTIAADLSAAVDRLRFGAPVQTVYNPLDYAWQAHEEYLRRFAAAPKRVVFLGMNPGPWGMVQTGIPFGEVEMVRDWLGIHAAVGAPSRLHPRRPVLGWSCTRREPSGRRLWGLIRERFGTPQAFFKDHFVANYCPLAFFDEAGHESHARPTARRRPAGARARVRRPSPASRPGAAPAVGHRRRRLRRLAAKDGLRRNDRESGQHPAPEPREPRRQQGLGRGGHDASARSRDLAVGPGAGRTATFPSRRPRARRRA